MTELLDEKICRDLRDTINKTDIFVKDSVEKEKFDLTCAVMDRIDSSINYINNNLDNPKNETELINFIVNCCTVRDGVNYLLKKLDIDKKDNNDFFYQVMIDQPFNLTSAQAKKISDDKFFEYFRSLVFAHPFETDRSIPNKISGEIQYSPYAIIDKHGIWRDKDSIGVMVYSNKRDMFSIILSFESLKKYIKYKYNLLIYANDEFNNIIKDKESKWKKRKINRDQSYEQILKEAEDILEERCLECYWIQKLRLYYSCENTRQENNKSLEIYKNKIESIIPKICDGLDNYEHEFVYDTLNEVIYKIPKGYPDMHYQLEKIQGYLTDDSSYSNIIWGLNQAKLFANGFAKKWVIIDAEKMSYQEIKMLTDVACYLEWNNQNNGGDLNE